MRSASRWSYTLSSATRFFGTTSVSSSTFMYHFLPGSAVARRKTFCTLLQHSCSYASLQFTTIAGWSSAGSVSLLTKKKLSSSWHSRRTHERVTSRSRVPMKRGLVRIPKPKSQIERPCAACDATRLLVSFHHGLTSSAGRRSQGSADGRAGLSATRFTGFPATSMTARVCGGGGGGVASGDAAGARVAAGISSCGADAVWRRKRIKKKKAHASAAKSLGRRPARHMRHAAA